MSTYRTYRFKLFNAFIAVFFGLFAISMSRAAADAATMQAPILSASEIGYPPFCIVAADGRASGFSVELLRATLAAMGRDVVFRTGPWDKIRGWLKKGEIQTLPLVGRTPEREHIFDFTFPYMSLHGAIVVRDDRSDVRDLSDLKGRRVAVMKGDNAEEFLRRMDRGIEIHTTATFETALQELSKGRYDAVIIQRLVALRLIQETGLKKLRIVNRPIEGFQQDFCFAVKEGDRETLALLNEGLALVMADGTYRHLHAKWFAAMELPTNRRIIVGGDHNYPPYEYLDDKGRPTGFNVELTRAIAQEMDFDIEIRLGPWSEIIVALEKGQIDALQGMFYSPERDLKFDFTPPHTANHCVSVVRKGEGPAPTTVDALTGKRIVVQAGDIMHDFARENDLGRQVSAVNSQEDALRELSEGKHDCALVSRVTAMYWIKKNAWDNLIMGQRPLLSPEYCYVVPNNHKALLAQFSEGLKILEETGEYRSIQEKWMGVYRERPLPHGNALRYSVMVLIPLVLIIIGFFLWTWSLRKQVASRTTKLKKSEEQYRLLADNLLDVIWTMSLDLEFTYVNPACFKLTGYTPEEWIGSRLPDHCDEENFAKMTRAITDEIAKGPEGSGIIFETVLLNKKREPVQVEIHGKMTYDDSGQLSGLQGVARNISEHKQAEAALRQSEERFRRISSTISDIVYSCKIDEDGRFSLNWMTGATERICGYSIDEIMAQKCWGFLVLKEDMALFEKNVSGLVPGSHASCELRIHHKDGSIVWIVSHAECTMATETPGHFLLYGGLRDITEHKRAEEENEKLQARLVQSQKMEAIGTLAGGIAHDFNNILSAIFGYTELALMKIDTETEIKADLKEVLLGAERAKDLVKQILAFSRQTKEEKLPVQMGLITKEALKLLRSSLPTTIDIRQNILSKSIVLSDPTQLHQIVMNLCTNAAHSMQANGGVLEVTLTDVALDSDFCSAHPEILPGAYLKLSVSDTGCGMTADVMNRIFDPFFTTKPKGEGTGLGLSVVHGIVKDCGGTTTVYSEPDKGTAFHLYFPIIAGRAEEKPEEHTIIPTGTERILVVDDEKAIIEIIQKILTSLGYAVEARTSSLEALELFKVMPDKFDLVITDMTMPQMTGDALARKLLKIRPDLPVILCTGFSEKMTHEKAETMGIKAFLQKPLLKKEMAHTIRRVLDE